MISSTNPKDASSPGPRLRDITSGQWKSGTAAWLGWLFDGLDMHLYTLVAAPFVAQLLQVSSPADPMVKRTSAWIQRKFLFKDIAISHVTYSFQSLWPGLSELLLSGHDRAAIAEFLG